MASPEVLDPEQLLQPIAGENPCGENMRWDPIYDEIKKARQEDSRDALEASEASLADWKLVVRKVSEVLTTRSKDLMLAGYLEEALVQLHGFAGMRAGLRVINGLLERFWDGLYPQVDGEDLEPRVAPIVWMTEPDRGSRLPNRIREIALTPTSDDGVVFSLAFSKSRFVPPKGENEEVDAFERRTAEGEARGRQFEAAVATVPAAFYLNVRDDIEQSVAEIGKLDALLDQKFGRAAPGLTSLKQALEECTVLVRRILKDKGALEPESVAAEGNGEQPAEGGAPGVPGVSGPIRTRADALRRLAEVAAFFRQTEPHSPVSYLVERAARWGTMTFEQLLGELVKDGTVREQIADLLAMKPPSE